MTAQETQSKTTSKIFPETYIPDYRFPKGWKTQGLSLDTDDPAIKIDAEKHTAPEKKTRKALLIVHGRGEHCGRYRHFPQYVSETVDRVYAFDLRGHGRSGGIRGHIKKFSEFEDDLIRVLNFVRSDMAEDYDEFQVHLFGHSMGGLVVLQTIKDHPKIKVSSVTLSAPLVKLKAKVPLVKKIAGYSLARVWDSLQIAYQSDPTVICHNPLVQKGVLEDRLCHTKATPKFFVELMSTLNKLREEPYSTSLPILFLVSEDDQVVDAHEAIALYEKMKDPKKRLISFKGFAHEMFNEYPDKNGSDLSRDVVFKELVNWIEENGS